MTLRARAAAYLRVPRPLGPTLDAVLLVRALPMDGVLDGAGADAGLAAAGATAAADGDADAAAYLRYAQRLGRWLRARRALLAAVWPMPDDADEPLC